jgi:hypothetical protein
MNLNPYEIALIAGGFTIIGTLLGGWITYRFAISLSRTNAKRDAGRKLRDAFAPELAALHPLQFNGGFNYAEMLRQAFDRHNMAVIEFEFYLFGKQLDRFKKAWNEYYEGDGRVRFMEYATLDGFNLFRKRVDSILKFTDT